MMDNFERRSSRPISIMLIPSIFILPAINSTSRNNATPSEDLPEPVLPTIPNFEPKKKSENWKLYIWKISISILFLYMTF